MADDVQFQTTAAATPPAALDVAALELGTSGAKAQIVLPGAQKTTAVAASVGGNTVIKATKGILGRVLVTVAGGAVDLVIYDNSTTNSGTIVGVVPAFSTAGSIFEFNMPCQNGITVQGNGANPGVTIAYA